MRKLLIFIGTIAFLFVYTNDVKLAQQDFITMDNGLRYLDLETGSGAVAETGMIVVVHLIGWLDHNGAKGSKFISYDPAILVRPILRSPIISRDETELADGDFCIPLLMAEYSNRYLAKAVARSPSAVPRPQEYRCPFLS
jgi:hypothetical protein